MSDGPLSPEEVAHRGFSTAFRGFDTGEVRAYLQRVANELRESTARERDLNRRLADAEHRAAHPVIQGEALTRLLGEEMARILATAQEAAAELKARAEENAARILREAHDQAQRVRERAEGMLAERTEEADGEAAEIRRVAAAEAASVVERARREAAEVAADAEARARDVVEEAQAVRGRVLGDLARRRRLLQMQVETLRAGRERLLDAYRVVRRSIDEVADELQRAESEAREAATAAGERAAAEADLAEGDELSAQAAPSEPPPSLAPADTQEAVGPGAPGPGDDDAPRPPQLRLLRSPTSPPAASPAAAVAEPPAPAERGTPAERAGGSPAEQTGAGSPPDDQRPSGVAGEAGVPSPTPRSEPTPAEPGSRSANDQKTEAGAERPAPQPGADQPAAGHAEEADATAAAPEAGPAERTGDAATVVEAGAGDHPSAGTGPAPGHDPAAAASAAPTTAPAEPSPGSARTAASAAGATEVGSPPTRTTGADQPSPAAGGSPSAAAPPPPAGAPATERGEPPDTGAGAPSTGAPADRPAEAPAVAVDELFARIRAGRADAVAKAHEVLRGEPPPSEPVEVPPPAAPGSPVAGSDEALLQRRDAAVEGVEARLARKLKRALQDEQNELLDRLRSARSLARADELLPSAADQAARYARAADDLILAAAAAGVSFATPGGGDARPRVDDVVRELASSIAEPLRRALERAVGSAAASGDPSAVVERIGAVYRECKAQRLEGLAGDAVTAAFGRGALAGLGPGRASRWVVDDDGRPCPDCDDNALAGPTAPGEAFPTGQAHPPAHAGCRCVLAPAEVAAAVNGTG